MKAREKGARTCVGCGKPDGRESLVRLVYAESEAELPVVVDAAGGGFGRGVHVHPSPACLEKAARGGLARSLRREIRIDASALAALVGDAYRRRALGLLGAAHRQREVALGADATAEALAERADAVAIVAIDAAHAASIGAVQHAIKDGRAVAWLDKRELGGLFGRAEVSVCAVTDPRIAAEIVRVIRMTLVSLGDADRSAGRLPADARGGAWWSREVR